MALLSTNTPRVFAAIANARYDELHPFLLAPDAPLQLMLPLLLRKAFHNPNSVLNTFLMSIPQAQEYFSIFFVNTEEIAATLRIKMNFNSTSTEVKQ